MNSRFRNTENGNFKDRMNKKKHILVAVIISISVFSLGYFFDWSGPDERIHRKYRLEIHKDSIYDGWYYEIYIYNDLAVQQMHIPGIPNKRPFLKKGDAENVGNLVLERIINGHSPNISKQDLNELQVSL